MKCYYAIMLLWAQSIISLERRGIIPVGFFVSRMEMNVVRILWHYGLTRRAGCGILRVTNRVGNWCPGGALESIVSDWRVRVMVRYGKTCFF